VSLPSFISLVDSKAVMQRAARLCAAAEPHEMDLAADQLPPGTTCILAAVRQLAVNGTDRAPGIAPRDGSAERATDMAHEGA